MKRILWAMAIVFFLSLSISFAGDEKCTGPVPIEHYYSHEKGNVIEFYSLCTADSSSGAFSNITVPHISGILMGVLFCADQSATPTTAMDITVEYGNTGFDMLNNGADLAVDKCYYREVLDDLGDKRIMPMSGDAVLKATGNLVPSAVFSVYIVIGR